jgi:hypothetical protein
MLFIQKTLVRERYVNDQYLGEAQKVVDFLECVIESHEGYDEHQRELGDFV